MENVNDKVGKAAKGHQDPVLMSVNIIGKANHFICKVNLLRQDIKSTSICSLSLQFPKRFMLIHILCDV